MSQTSLDIRQSQTRTLQDQLNSASTTQMDSTLASINNELTIPGRLIAAATPSLVVTVGSGTVTNPNTGKNRVTPLINNTFPNFPGGTITFPSTSGTITVSPGTNGTITIGASQFCAVLVQLNAAGQLSIVVGTAAGSLGAVVVPGGSTSLLSLGYIIVQTNGSSVIQNVTNAMLYQFSGGGGAGSSGSGTGDDLDALQFRASFTELFTDLPTGSTSSINLTTGFTNASYSTSLNMYTGSYDASKTIASGTNSNTVVVSSAPSFTVKAGDIVVTGTQAAKITTVNSQTNYTVETLSTVPSIGAQVTVSEAIHTIDIYNSTVGGTAALSSAFPGTTMSEVLIDYKDNSSSTSNVFTPDTGPFAGFTASVDNSNWSTVQDRPALALTQQQSTITPTSGSDLYLRFFSIATSGTGVFSLIMYKAFMQKATAAAANYNTVWSSYGTTNNSATPVNCTISVQGGKSTITFTNGNQYPIGVLSGQTVGSLFVTLNGQVLPRFVSSSVPSTDAYYTEVSGTVIQLDRDYSSQQLDIQVEYALNTVDSSSTNTTQITNTQTFLTTPPAFRSIAAGQSGTIGLDYVFYTAACNATAGATYTNNGVTFTVLNTVSGATQLVANGTNIPLLAGTLTKASGTGDASIIFFAYKAPLWIRVKMAGPGGGGAGGGIATPTNGTAGSAATTFGTSFLSAGAGSFGIWQSAGGAGGTASITGSSGFYTVLSLNGGGGGGFGGEGGGVNTVSQSGSGGGNSFGPGGNGGGPGAAQPGITPGAGGGGGGCSSSGGTATWSGAGGGAGAYIEVIIFSLALSYAYSVGTGGNAGTGTTAGGNGGAGAGGIILIESHYVGG